jgi:uncharacterized protein
MFKRKKRLRFPQRAGRWLYPKAGWRRAFRYWRHRALRLPGSPESIARGLACGAAVSFTPFIGFHLLFSFLLAWIMRGNLYASAIGTLIGNPFTAFFIWALIYQVGAWMMDRQGNLAHIREFGAFVVKHPTKMLETLPEIFEPVLLPMIVGSIPIAVLVWLLTYWLIRGVVAEYRILRKARAAHRQGRFQEAK